MDIKRKMEIVQAAVDSISQHDDEDSAVRIATLNRVIAMLQKQVEALRAKSAARIEEVLGT